MKSKLSLMLFTAWMALSALPAAFGADVTFDHSVTNVLRECKVFRPGAGWTSRPGTGEREHDSSNLTSGYCIERVVIARDRDESDAIKFDSWLGKVMTIQYFRSNRPLCNVFQKVFFPKACKREFIDMLGYPAGYRLTDENSQVVDEDFR